MVQLLGAGAFGALIGWYVYYINRYRTEKVQFSDLVTLIGIIGGATVTALFQEGTEAFGAYGIGLAVGFFGYFVVLGLLVASSENFNADFFLDGRRIRPKEPYYIPAEWRPAASSGMGLPPDGGGNGDRPVPEPQPQPAGRRTR